MSRDDYMYALLVC